MHRCRLRDACSCIHTKPAHRQRYPQIRTHRYTLSHPQYRLRQTDIHRHVHEYIDLQTHRAHSVRFRGVALDTDTDTQTPYTEICPERCNYSQHSSLPSTMASSFSVLAGVGGALGNPKPH